MKEDIDLADDQIAMVRCVLEISADGVKATQDQVAHLSQLAGRVAATRRNSAELAANALATRLDLDEGEDRLLWTIVAHTLDPTVRKHCDSIFGREMNAIELARLAYSRETFGEGLDRLSASGRLRRFALIERANQAEVHESRWSWIAATRVITWLHGSVQLDPQVSRFARLIEDAPPNPHFATSPEMKAKLAEELDGGGLVIVSGSVGTGRRTILRMLLADCGKAVLEVDCERLGTGFELRSQLQQIARESRLLQRVTLLRELQVLAPEDLEIVEELVESSALVMATSRSARIERPWRCRSSVVRMSTPTTSQRVDLWRRSLGALSDEDARFLANQYPLAPALVARVGLLTATTPHSTVKEDDVYEAIREVVDADLGRHAKRIEVTQKWSDLVLSSEQVASIRELIARVRQRQKVYEDWGFAAKVGKGLGVGALFSGPPGTGKTMVAALIAKDLGLEIYQVDISKIVSKYIGETEKQLAAVFDAAEAGHAILLFDEADSLFGKRTEVKSSNDRYANLETNYLLQRMESYTGIVLLTSNHESNIDPAFQRRLSLHLRFDMPDTAERELLWKAMLPAQAPVDEGVSFETLAQRYVMSGGYIRNAALRAAFMAADESKAIGQAHLDRAARLEYEGMGKLAMWG